MARVKGQMGHPRRDVQIFPFTDYQMLGQILAIIHLSFTLQHINRRFVRLMQVGFGSLPWLNRQQVHTNPLRLRILSRDSSK
jgi:hypothetical protein